MPSPRPALTKTQLLVELRRFFGSKRVSFKDKDALWSILSALRGPDSPDENFMGGFSAKSATTAVIRTAFFGKASDRASSELSISASPDSPGKAKRRQKSFASTHFRNHAEWAFRALGLKWYEANEAK